MLEIITAFWGTWGDVIFQTIGLFAVIATITPNQVDNKVAQVLMDVINLLGANIGRASNSDDEDLE